MKKITLMFLLLLVILSGCASGNWTKDDMSNFDRDVSECNAMSQYSVTQKQAYGRTEVVQQIDWSKFNQCMQYRGTSGLKIKHICCRIRNLRSSRI